MAVVNLAEEVLGGVLQAAEQLQGSVVAAETGTVECLRWAGALPLLLRDLSVQNVVSAEVLFACETSAQLRRFLLPPHAWSTKTQGNGEEEAVGHLVVIVTGFLWDYEAPLTRVLKLGVIRRLTLCSSLSERAHECYDFEKLSGGVSQVPNGAKATKTMRFDEFAAKLEQNGSFPKNQHHKAPASNKPTSNIMVKEAPEAENDDEEWGWTDETPSLAVKEEEMSPQPLESAPSGVQVLHLPLNFAPLLSSKTFTPEPSVFVLCHPICASAFPLLLHQVLEAKTISPTSPTNRGGTAGLSSGESVKRYSNVKEVLPEHIPSSFRRSMRLLAHTLAEMLVTSRLEVKERIFAMGGTSLKIGHTLLRILNEIQEDTNTQATQGQQAASVVLIDRTCDLASPCSFGSSLLDRVLALLPQTPTPSAMNEAVAGSTKRAKLHVTEIFPLHGCKPTPLAMPVPAIDAVDYQASEFVSQIQWKGGASLCHPTLPNGANVFRSLAFRPAKLALRDLDKRLQVVEQSLIQQGSIQKTAAIRKAGEKARGRDVVLRRICKVLEAGEPTNIEHSSLVELGVIVLETLERMDKTQQQWDKCRERAMRQIQLRKQDGREWIIPELADAAQRQLATALSSAAVDEEPMYLPELLTLLVHAFALSSGAPLEDFTVQMIRKVLIDCVLQTAVANPTAVQTLFPELLEQISAYIAWKRSQVPHEGVTNGAADNVGANGDDWDWNDGSNSPSAHKEPAQDSDLLVVEAKSIVEAHVEALLGPLKECAQQFAKLSEEEYAPTAENPPRSLIAQLCSAIVDPTRTSIPELERVVDASEQLTRAGIDLLKSGFSKFGFGVGAGGAGGQSSAGRNRLLGESEILVVFVVGGITFEEIQEVHDALSDNTRYQIILGGTTITNNDVILEQLFSVAT